MKINKYLVAIVFLLFSYSVISQDDKKSDDEYSAKKSFAIGVFGGMNFLLGDVPQDGGYGFGLNIQKALGHSVLLRLQLGYGSATGLDPHGNFGNMIIHNDAINGVNGPNYYNNPDPTVNSLTYNNFKTTLIDGSLQIAYNFTLGDFRTAEFPKLNIFVFGGIGALVYNTKVDQLDASGNEYDFTTIDITKEDGERKTDLQSLLDGEYETPAEGNPESKGTVEGTAMLGGNLIPVAVGGLGIRVKLSPRIDLSLEGKVTYTANDFIDGQRWNLQGSLTSNDDILAGVFLGLNFRLGRTENIYWFDNPHAMHYKTTLENKRKIGMLTTDGDNDGVADYWDKDPETPEGVPVDGAGRPLDIDNDQIPDYRDNDPFSDRGAIVDSSGVAIDSDGDGVPDHRDVEDDTPEGTLVNFQGKAIAQHRQPVYRQPTSDPATADRSDPKNYDYKETGQKLGDLGWVKVPLFAFNEYVVEPSFRGALSELALAMKGVPEARIRLTGYTDTVGTIEYNYQLGMKRAQAVFDVLVSYGVPAKRMEIDSKGKLDQVFVAGADQDRANRRVAFSKIGGSVSSPVEQPSSKPPKSIDDDLDLDDIEDILNE